jgi:anaerobic selenocysteine-containing dehydrogenase
VRDYPPQQVARICGVDAEQIRAAARVLGQARRLLSTVVQGFYQAHQASANVIRAMLGKPDAGSCK